jgi:hypothetical protein
MGLKIRNLIPERKKIFFLLRSVQTGPEACPTSYTLDAIGLILGSKVGREKK